MKKKAIVLLAFVAALTAVSCQKEAMKEAETTPTGEGMTVSAVSEGLGSPTKTELAFKYDVLWSNNDKIYVEDASGNHDTFTLQNGAGTTKGTFKQDGEVKFTGEVQAYYPATMLESGSPVWPASQANNQTIPMYCKKTLSGATEERMDFNSLGSVLQLNFNTTTADIVLKSIEVKADEAMSGAFTIENGQAKVSQPEGDKPGITLDLGEGVALGTSAKKFNIAVPAGEYHGLSIVFTATDGKKKCTINAKKDKAIEIVYNTVNTLAVSGEFKYDLPAGALPGVFTVSNDDGTTKTQIFFSQGNLWADASGTSPVFYFETNQYDFQSSWKKSHASHFHWSKTESVAYATSYSGTGATADDVFFTNADETTAKEGFTVNVDGKEQSGWRTLSTNEWKYLFNTRTVNGGQGEGKSYSRNITYGGKKGLVLYPDDYDNYPVPGTVTYLPDGVVFLPAAGFRYGGVVRDVGDCGYYWSSTAHDNGGAYYAYFYSSKATPDCYGGRDYASSVRLITEVK